MYRPTTPHSPGFLPRYELPDTPTAPPAYAYHANIKTRHGQLPEMACHPAFAPPRSQSHRVVLSHPPIGWRQKLRTKKSQQPAEIHELSAVKSLPNSKSNSKRTTRTLGWITPSSRLRSKFSSNSSGRWSDDAEQVLGVVAEYDGGATEWRLHEDDGGSWPLNDTWDTVSPVSETFWKRGGTVRTAVISPVSAQVEGKMF